MNLAQWAATARKFLVAVPIVASQAVAMGLLSTTLEKVIVGVAGLLASGLVYLVKNDPAPAKPAEAPAAVPPVA